MRQVFQFLVKIATNPLFISFIISFVTILLFLPDYPKYQINVVDSESLETDLVFYDDLDGNGYSDKIFIGANFIGNSFLVVKFFPSLNSEEWDFPGKFSFYSKEYIITGDFDNNNVKEIYTFTLSHDSILLHSVSDYFKPTPEFKTRFISKINQINGKCDPVIIKGEMVDLNEDGFKELIFAIGSGFSISPRNVFAYDITNDTLLISPRSGAHITGLRQFHIHSPEKNIIALINYTSKNILDSSFQYHDRSSWLMVLDNKLQFLFPPVEYPLLRSNIVPFCIEFDEANSFLGAQVSSEHNKESFIKLIHYNTNGIILKEKVIRDFEPSFAGLPFVTMIDNTSFIIIPNEGGIYYLYDTTFALVRQINTNTNLLGHHLMDVDDDGKNEVIAYFPFGRNLDISILRGNLTHPASLTLPLDSNYFPVFSVKRTLGEPPLLSVNAGRVSLLISYQHNPMYYNRWGIYAGFFFAFYLFILLIRKIAQAQMKKRYDTQKKMTELQLKIVRNQMDPHFILNAINSIMASVDKKEGRKVNHALLAFSKLYRSLVLSADQIKRTLREELDFTENYLSFENFRIQDKFTYDISIAPSVNLDWNVPKMVIQSSVENAVKHGLLHKNGGGILKIRAYSKDHLLILEIEDNGVGRSFSREEDFASTGKGQQIMEHFYDLYHQLTGVRVHSEIHDLCNETGEPNGTKVQIFIPQPQ